MSFANFECDKCGDCCRNLFVEADYCDALREPRLFDIAKVDRNKLRNGESAIFLWDTERNCCPFLGDEGCGIYSTRPAVCVIVEPGDVKCQQARVEAGREPLRDRDGRLPTAEQLYESSVEYGCEVPDYDWPEGG